MSTSIVYYAVAVCENKIYCIGRSDYWIDEVDVNEVYDIHTGHWSTKSPPPITGYNLQAHVIDGKLFVISYRYAPDYRIYMHVYNPSTDSWTEINCSLVPPQQSYFHSFVMDDKIMFIGNFYLDPVLTIHQRTVDKIFVYDPIDTWAETDLIPPVSAISIETAVATTGIYAPQKIYFIQRSEDIDTVPSTIAAYDPVNDICTYKKMPIPLAEYKTVVVIDDILYVIGNRRENTGQISHGSGQYIHNYFPVNLQYVPVGYHGVLPSAELPFKPIILVASVIIISTVSVILIYSNFYKKRRLNVRETEVERHSETAT